jgi:hypothetical protein
MNTITAEEFFRLYEQANNDFEVQLISKLYADTFMFANLQGVQAVKKEDFVKVLPRRKDFMKAAGLLSSRVDSVEATTLDSKYILVKTVWNMLIRFTPLIVARYQTRGCLNSGHGSSICSRSVDLPRGLAGANRTISRRPVVAASLAEAEPQALAEARVMIAQAGTKLAARLRG